MAEDKASLPSQEAVTSARSVRFVTNPTVGPDEEGAAFDPIWRPRHRRLNSLIVAARGSNKTISPTPKMAHQRSSSSMSRASKQPSPTSSTFKSALSSLNRAATNTSNKSALSYTPGDDSIFSIPADPLPTDPRELEGFLNRHLSALDHLKRTVEARNQEIREYCTRAAYFYNLKPRACPQFLRQLDAEIHVLRAQRNGLQALVQMRHDEIVRIAEHRKAMDEENGLKCTVYDMYLGFRKLDEWEVRFSV
jgi:hypothetical protein